MAFSALALFVAGVLLMPAFHSLDSCHSETSGHGKTHDPYTCVICAVAAIALVVVSAHVVVAAVRPVPGVVSLGDFFISDSFIPTGHHPRAPPVR